VLKEDPKTLGGRGEYIGVEEEKEPILGKDFYCFVGIPLLRKVRDNTST
jgi:hypothetical protein